MADEKKKENLDEMLEKIRKPIRPHDEDVVLEKMERPEAWPPPKDDSEGESNKD